MRLFRIPALFGVTLLVCVYLASCGGNSNPPAPPTPVSVVTQVLAQGAVNNAYSAFLQASGGTGPYTWSISSGSLPDGLTLNSTNGAISGTPTTAGKFSFTAKATDSASATATANLSITILGAVIVDTSSLPYGNPGVPYSATLSASGGQGPYTWSLTSGSLPDGLMLSATTGTISGTPTTAASPVTFTVQATDSETPPANGSAILKITIIAIGTKSLPNATINVAYNQSMTVSGGMLPFTWSITSGSLPPGLSLGNGCSQSRLPTCSIVGTPTQLGVFAFTVQVQDGETPSAIASAQLSIDVQGPLLSVTTMALPAGNVGLLYNAVMQASGGIPPLTWCVVESNGGCDNGAGTLPAGLTMSSSGVISGTPTTTGMSAFVIQVQDAENPPQIARSAPSGSNGGLSITINPAINNSTLNGNYAFSFNGYNNGNPYLMAGSFVADGNGNLTSGVLDLNDGTGELDGQGNVVPQTITTGSVYDLSTRHDGLGTMTIVTNLGTYKFSIVLTGNACLPSESSATCGRLIANDVNNPQIYGSGALKVQNTQDFPINKLFPGNFALLFAGTDPAGSRYAGAGAFGAKALSQAIAIDCSSGTGGNGWGLDGCPSDVNDSGQAASDPIKGTLSSSIGHITGRGTYVHLFFPSDPQGQCLTEGTACNYAYYVVNRNELILISADPITNPDQSPRANLTLWSAMRQPPTSATGWSLSALKGTSVVELNAVDPNSGNPLADITAGLLTGDGSGGATFSSDENDGGTLNLLQSSPGTYAFGTTGSKTGRLDLSGFSQFGANGAVAYLFNSNTAFVVGADAKVTSGVLEPQTGTPFSNASVAGRYAGGSVSPVLSAVTNSVASLFADGAGNITGTQDTSGQGGPGQSDLTLTYQVDATGRAIVQQGANQYGILYVVSPTKMVLLPVADSAPALNSFGSGPVF